MIESNGTITSMIIIYFASYTGLLLHYYWHGDQLFRLLSNRHPKYYKAIGEPMYFADPLSNWRSCMFLMLLLIRDMPKEFPKDAQARSLALRNRKIGCALVLYLVAVFALAAYFLLSR